MEVAKNQEILANDAVCSAEIASLLVTSKLRSPSSVTLGWDGLAVERHSLFVGEKPEVTLDKHFLLLFGGHVSEGEVRAGAGRFRRYRKLPNTFTLCPPGVRSALHSRTPTEVIVGELNGELLHQVQADLGMPVGDLLPQLYGDKDDILNKLLRLLLDEAAAGGPNGRLFSDTISIALVTRLVHATQRKGRGNRERFSPLPLQILRRVTELMRSGLNEPLRLDALALESGYSKSHFLRMFHLSTGKPPHRYLLDLRLEEAQRLLASRDLSLIDIAAACGFSSHAHLTTAFRARTGTTPSRYRRTL